MVLLLLLLLLLLIYFTFPISIFERNEGKLTIKKKILAFEKRGAYWAIRTASGAYIGANEEGRVYNTSNEVTDNEKWTKYKLGKHQSYYQSFHGKYLCADEHGCVVADRIKPKKWEVWKHEWIN